MDIYFTVTNIQWSVSMIISFIIQLTFGKTFLWEKIEINQQKLLSIYEIELRIDESKTYENVC